MATISRFSAVASVGRAQFSGFFAWVMWLAVHLVYIIGFKHRITTLLHWGISFLGRGRAERVVTQQQVFARTAIEDLGRRLPPRAAAGGQGPPGRAHPGDRAQRAGMTAPPTDRRTGPVGSTGRKALNFSQTSPRSGGTRELAQG